VHKDMTESLNTSITGLDIPDGQRRLVWESFRHREERFVDHMSRVLQPLI